MTTPDPTEIAITALRAAVAGAPQNVDLVHQLARLLTSLGRHEEAATTLTEALKRRPGHRDLQVALAEAYYRGGKDSHALAILETLAGSGSLSPAGTRLLVRLRQRGGDTPAAVALYKDLIEDDPEAADAELESLLGIDQIPGSSRPVRMGSTADGPVEIDEDDDAGEPDDEPLPIDRPKEGFESVGGMEAIKEEIRVKIIHPIEHADVYAAYGKKIGGGILMYGPPGCGKTHLARATAGEVSAGFVVVGINDVLDMYLGNSERKLAMIFAAARKKKPTVLFFDEVDALGASRTDMKRSAGRQLINQFLSELDGADHSNDGVLILAATNSPWHMDSAFRRPGRFDRVIFVPPPDQTARVGIVEILLRGKPLGDVSPEKIARKTDGFSGADLKAVVDRAVESKLSEAIRTGKPRPIETADLLTAVKATRPSTREWFATARNHALYANESGLYDDVLQYLGVKP